MLGWINDCTEKLVIAKFGVEVWHAVKEKAGCKVKDGGFLKLEHYPDASTVDLVQAASEMSGLSVPQVYEAFGTFFVEYIIGEGYEDLLCCQGSTLKDWMTNINAIHQHLQTTFPKKMTMPEFWCEENEGGTLSLFYFSSRGNFLAPLAVGLVSEVAKRQFELDIDMRRRTTQGVEGAKFTSWIVSTKDPNDLPKLSTKQGTSNGIRNAPTTFKCPMSGVEVNSSDIPSMVITSSSSDENKSLEPTSGETTMKVTGSSPSACPYSRRISLAKSTSTHSTISICSTEDEDTQEDNFAVPGGLSPAATRRMFPYHVVIDSEFCITQVGKDLPRILGTTSAIINGNEIDEIFDFIKPKPAKWTRSWMRKLEDQEFLLACSLSTASHDVFFKGTIVRLSRKECMLVLSPDAKSLEELRDMNLTLSDLPAHGAYRDEIFLREHLSRQMNNALKMEKLSRTLQDEKELLESLIPRHAADGLRKGQQVKPRFHDNVTMFFSDIVGFTNICNHITPNQVIDMLNKLYGLMDFLAEKFCLFKIETIGDAYVCCSGLPQSDDRHAVNVANFAIAVQHCSQRVLSPLDNAPLQLRIGINSGPCASGIVGKVNPRYCVFGDTVNTTARHESAGEAGRVHCSLTTMVELQKQAEEDFDLISRGMVEMKGKGEMATYWLEASESNAAVGPKALSELHAEITTKFKGNIDLAPAPPSKSRLFPRAPSRKSSNSSSGASLSSQKTASSSTSSRSASSKQKWASMLARSSLKSHRSGSSQQNKNHVDIIKSRGFLNDVLQLVGDE